MYKQNFVILFYFILYFIMREFFNKNCGTSGVGKGEGCTSSYILGTINDRSELHVHVLGLRASTSPVKVI